MDAPNRTTPFLIVGIVVIILIIGSILWFVLGKSNTPAPSQTATSTNPFSGSSATTNVPNANAPATHYTDNGQYFQVDLQYPSQTPLTTTAGSAADMAAVQTMKDFATKSGSNFVTENDLKSITAADAAAQGLDQGRKYELSDTYQFYSSPNTVSYLFSIYTDTLGAHPNGYFQSYTFDAKNGKQLALADIFNTPTYLNTLSSITRGDLIQQLGSDADSDAINAGTAPSDTNFQNFVLDGDSLTIFFPPYQVAAYAVGPQTVKIPLSQITDILNPAYK